MSFVKTSVLDLLDFEGYQMSNFVTFLVFEFYLKLSLSFSQFEYCHKLSFVSSQTEFLILLKKYIFEFFFYNLRLATIFFLSKILSKFRFLLVLQFEIRSFVLIWVFKFCHHLIFFLVLVQFEFVSFVKFRFFVVFKI